METGVWHMECHLSGGKGAGACARYGGTDWTSSDPPQSKALALEPSFSIRVGLSPTQMSHRGRGAEGYLPAPSVGVRTGEQEGCLNATSGHREECSGCCLHIYAPNSSSEDTTFLELLEERGGVLESAAPEPE